MHALQDGRQAGIADKIVLCEVQEQRLSFTLLRRPRPALAAPYGVDVLEQVAQGHHHARLEPPLLPRRGRATRRAADDAPGQEVVAVVTASDRRLHGDAVLQQRLRLVPGQLAEGFNKAAALLRVKEGSNGPLCAEAPDEERVSSRARLLPACLL